MQKILTLLALLFSGLFVYGQNLPIGFSDSERDLMPTYLQQFKSKQIKSNNFFTSPPASSVRAMGEWEEIDGLLVTWTSYLSTVREIIRWARLETTVWVVCDDSLTVKASLSSNNIPLSNIKYLQIPFNSVWARDYGQWNVYSNEVDSLFLIDWIYNRPRPEDDAIPEQLALANSLPLYQLTQDPYNLTHTGGNFMVDGYGTAFSSELILDENADKTPAQVDTIMKNFMGINRYIKMPILPYDGIHHIDMHLKLLDEETLLWGEYPNGVADGPQIEANLQYIQSNYPSVFGTPYKIVRILQPPELYQGNLYYPDNGGAYLTYTNAVFVNKTVLVTQYRPEYDTTARRIWETALPGYKIQFIDCNSIIQASGALHCITKEVGASNPLLITHQPLTDIYNSSAPYLINAWIKHRSGIETASIYYRTDTTLPYQQVPMNLIDPLVGTYSGSIPPQVVGSKIYYYIQATSNSGKTQVRPMPAPLGYWQFRVLGPVSILDVKADFETRLFPNPSKGMVCLEINIGIEKEIKADVFNVIGQKVGNFVPGLLNTGTSKLFFDASNITEGVYFISISSQELKKTMKLLVK